MAITKILTIGDSGVKFSGKHLEQAVSYILDREKTQGGRLVTGINCQPGKAYEQMAATKRKYGKTDKRQGYHLIISFEAGEASPDTAFEIIWKFVEEYLGQEYEAVLAVHDNTAHVHGHIIFNSVNYHNGRKYRYEKGDWAKKIQPITNRLCEEYGLSTIEIEEHGRKRNELRDGKFIWREMIQRDVEACIMQAESFEEFLDLMVEKEYDIKQNKYLAVKPKGMQRFCRCKSLGEDYTEERIRERIRMESLETYAKRNREQNPHTIEPPGDEFLRRTKLTGIQKTYYTKICRLRHLERLPYSKAWEYREEIRKMQEVHEKYLFLVKNGIHSLTELAAARDNLKEKAAECGKERRELYREKRQMAPLFSVADKMLELAPAEKSYQAGDKFFEKEHLRYQALEGQLRSEGYSLEEIEMLRKKYKDKGSGIYERQREIRKRLKMAGEMIAEFTESLERARDRQEEKTEQEMSRNSRSQK
ncbi:hypothetical protein C806_04827 [Lachnospiraceae bacterium 3-1]|nr:hypothetical protein C806_04827 [Lachnospiraceae bacterium 3-1]